MLFVGFFPAQQYISVSYKTPEELVKDVLIGAANSSCLTVSNVSITNWQNFGNHPFSYGYFEKGTLPFDIDKGIILSTGSAAKSPGPASPLLDDADAKWPGDPDLVAAMGNGAYLNATVLEFDFISTNSTGISFQYMFLSEEYRPVNCTYSDGFAFLIKKAASSDPYENIALVPGTNDPVNSLNINPSPTCTRNAQYFGGFNGANSPTIFDGQTKVLTAKAKIAVGEKYHIKLVIADHLAGNDRTGRYDSAVFLKAGSFVGDKDLGPDLVINTHNAICEGESKPIDGTTSGATAYKWYKDGVALTGEINAKLTIFGAAANAGNYQLEVNLSGCILNGSINVEIQPKAIIIDNQNFPVCDEKLNGQIPVNFSSFNSSVVSNFNPTFNVKYYLNETDAQYGTGTPLTDGWLLQTNTTIYFRVESLNGCLPQNGKLNLVVSAKTPVLTQLFSDSVCDNTLSGTIEVDLSSYIQKFTSDLGASVSYFDSLADAKTNTNPINALQNISTGLHSFGIRIQSSGACPNVAELIIEKKSPRKSEDLKNQEICKDATTTLNAGTGFDYFKWSTGEEGNSLYSISNVGIGNYWVELSSNGCIYRQEVVISAAAGPQISNIEVEGNTATIYANGAHPPFEYSLDGVTFQASNIFTNIPKGLQTAFVRDAKKCEITTKKFLVLNLINVITPNDDGINDVLDYSDLSIKSEVEFSIYDRYGSRIFYSETPPYIWTGKINGRVLPTGTYWYVLKWIEPDTQIPLSYTGWILLKNRN